MKRRHLIRICFNFAIFFSLLPFFAFSPKNFHTHNLISLIQKGEDLNVISTDWNQTEVLSPEPEPQVPYLSNITPYIDNDGIVSLKWEAIQGSIAYYLFRNVSFINSVGNLIPLAKVSENSYQDNITSPGIYYYVVQAETAVGNSSCSNCEWVLVLNPNQLWDGLFLAYSFETFIHDHGYHHGWATFSYSKVSEDLFSVWWNNFWSELYNVSKISRIINSNMFGNGVHTPIWIFRNVTVGSLVPIAHHNLTGNGVDHLYKVTGDFVYIHGLYGPLDVWILEDINNPESFAWYEKSTGFLIKGRFIEEDNPKPTLFEFIQGNLDFPKLSNDRPPELIPLMGLPIICDQKTLINFSVIYKDPDGFSPAFVNLIINGSTYIMEDDGFVPASAYAGVSGASYGTNDQGSTHLDYKVGRTYHLCIYLQPGNYEYYFECSDGKLYRSSRTFDDLRVNNINLNAPKLSDIQVITQNVYDARSISVIVDFIINYTDTDNNPPEFINLRINSTSYSMVQKNLWDVNYTDGNLYGLSITFKMSEFLTYSFSCSDGIFNAFIGPFNESLRKPFYDGLSLAYKYETHVGYGSYHRRYGDSATRTFVYSHIVNSLFHVTMEWDSYDIDALTGVISNSQTAFFQNSVHSPLWIPRNLTVGDKIFRGLDYDWEYQVTDEMIYNFPEIGLIDILILTGPYGAFGWYEKHTGILLKGCFYIFYYEFVGHWFRYFELLDYNLYIPLLNATRPELVNISVSPESGNQNTEFNFSLVYKDKDNDPPVTSSLIINGTKYPMIQTDVSNLNYSKGCLYQQLIYLKPGIYYYSFEFDDGFFISKTNISELRVEYTNNHIPYLIPLQSEPQCLNDEEKFNFSVLYIDQENNPPDFINLKLNGINYSLDKRDPFDLFYTDGCIYQTSIRLFQGDNQYFFECNDSKYYSTTSLKNYYFSGFLLSNYSNLELSAYDSYNNSIWWSLTEIGIHNYLGEFSFTDHADGIAPKGWMISEGASTYCEVISEKERHLKVIDLFDNSPYHRVEMSHNFSRQEKGTIEFWIYVSQSSNSWFYCRFESDSTIGFTWFICNGLMGIYQITDYKTDFVQGRWYHIKLDFNCTSNKIKAWTNGLYEGEFNFSVPVEQINKITFTTSDTKTSSCHFYLDAIDFSWGADYYNNRNLEHKPISNFTYTIFKDGLRIENWKPWSNQIYISYNINGKNLGVGIHNLSIVVRNSVNYTIHNDVLIKVIPGISINNSSGFEFLSNESSKSLSWKLLKTEIEYSGIFTFNSNIFTSNITNWNVAKPEDSNVFLIPSKDGHKNVVELFRKAELTPSIENVFSPKSANSESQLEFWIWGDTNAQGVVEIGNGGYGTSTKIWLWLNFFSRELRNVENGGNSVRLLSPNLNSNEWNHFRIKPGSKSFQIWLNNNSLGIIPSFESNGYVQTNFDRIRICSYNHKGPYSIYIDAVDYSWETNYYLNRNMHSTTAPNINYAIYEDGIRKTDWNRFGFQGNLNYNLNIQNLGIGLHNLSLVWFDSNNQWSHEDVIVKISPFLSQIQSPTLTSITPNPNLDGTIQLNWSAVEGATCYYIYRNLSFISSIENLIPIANITQNFYHDLLFQEGNWSYVIVAGNSIVNSSISNYETVEVRKNHPLFNGMYLNYVYYDDYYTSSQIILNYSFSMDTYFQVVVNNGEAEHIVNIQDRTVSNDSSGMEDGIHTPFWIFNDISEYDIIKIGMDSDKDYWITGSRTYNLPGVGDLDVWVLDCGEGYFWYEKTTGIMVKGKYLLFEGFGPYWVYYDLLSTNEFIVDDPTEPEPDTTPPPQVTGASVTVIPTGTALNLTWDASPAIDLAEYVIYRDLSPGFSPDSSNLYQRLTNNHFMDTGLTNGVTYYYRIAAVDEVPNYGVPSAEISGTPRLIDTTKPINVSIVSPIAGDCLKGLIQIQATAEDNPGGSGIKNVTFWLDGIATGTFLGTDSTFPYALNWDSTTTTEGTHELSIQAFDYAGNSQTSPALPIIIDNTNPSIALITSPSNLSNVNGLVSINVTAADVGSGVKQVEFWNGPPEIGTLLGIELIAPYVFIWNTSTELDGYYGLFIRVIDNVGNYLDSTGVYINVKNTIDPPPNLFAPEFGDRFSYVWRSNISTTFYIFATYIDRDNDTPTYVNVIINGTAYPMTKRSSSDTNYMDGCNYTYLTYLKKATYVFVFNCSDGIYSNTTKPMTMYLPTLENCSVSSSIGTQETRFCFSATYQSQNNYTPEFVRVIINGTSYSMMPSNESDTTYSDGKIYNYACNLEPGIYNYTFEASNYVFTNVPLPKFQTLIIYDASIPTLTNFSLTSSALILNNPNPSVICQVRSSGAGINISSVQYAYSPNGTVNPINWASVDGIFLDQDCTIPASDGDIGILYLKINNVPFQQFSLYQNTIRFRASDLAGIQSYQTTPFYIKTLQESAYLPRWDIPTDLDFTVNTATSKNCIILFNFQNTGNLTLVNLTFTINLPPGWGANVNSLDIYRVDPQTQATVIFEVTIPDSLTNFEQDISIEFEAVVLETGANYNDTISVKISGNNGARRILWVVITLGSVISFGVAGMYEVHKHKSNKYEESVQRLLMRVRTNPTSPSVTQSPPSTAPQANLLSIPRSIPPLEEISPPIDPPQETDFVSPSFNFITLFKVFWQISKSFPIIDTLIPNTDRLSFLMDLKTLPEHEILDYISTLLLKLPPDELRIQICNLMNELRDLHHYWNYNYSLEKIEELIYLAELTNDHTLFAHIFQLLILFKYTSQSYINGSVQISTLSLEQRHPAIPAESASLSTFGTLENTSPSILSDLTERAQTKDDLSLFPVDRLDIKEAEWLHFEVSEKIEHEPFIQRPVELFPDRNTLNYIKHLTLDEISCEIHIILDALKEKEQSSYKIFVFNRIKRFLELAIAFQDRNLLNDLYEFIILI